MSADFATTLFHFMFGDFDGSFAAFGHGVRSVRPQVPQNLLDLSGIGENRGLLRRVNHTHLARFSDCAREHAASFSRYRIEIKQQWRRPLLATEGEELFCQTRAPLRRGGNSLDISPSRVIGTEIIEQEFRTSQNHIQKVVEVVCYPTR